MAREFEDYVDESEFDVIDVSEGTDSYNFTIQFDHENTQISDITETGNGFCDSFVEIYGSDKTCIQCGDIVTYAVYSSNTQTYNLLFVMVVVIGSFILY